MRTCIILLALTLSLAAAGSATASPITQCGYWNGLTWSKTPPLGFSVHLTTRNVRCYFARSFMRRYRGTDTFYPTWKCRELNAYESQDVRCVSGTRVIRWVGGD
jgi:hypothetical protein